MSYTLATEPRPLSFGEIVQTAWDVFTAHGRALLAISAPVVFPVSLITSALLLVTASLVPETVEDPTPDDLARATAVNALTLAILVAGYLVMLVPFGALVRAAGDALSGDRPDPGRSYRVALNRYRRLVGTFGVQTVVVLVLSLTLVGIPLAVFFFVKWLLAQQVVVLENARTRPALSRSWALVSGAWWRTLAVFLFFALATLIPSTVAEYAVRLLLFPLGGLALDVVVTLAALAASAAVGVAGSAFALTGITVLYYDLKAREAQRVGPA